MSAKESRPTGTIRLLIIDMTLCGDGTATGELKATLLDHWEQLEVGQFFSPARESVGFSGTVSGEPVLETSCRDSRCMALVEAFDPDCILYRPTPDNGTLHELAMRLIQTRPLPLITWIMDDWPARLEQSDPGAFELLNSDLEWLLHRSFRCLCISDRMKEAFEPRYGVAFTAIANGVDPNEWTDGPAHNGSPLTIRYAGSLAEDMTLFSLLDVAEAVQALADDGYDIAFELNTRASWAALFGHRFRRFAACSISTEELSTTEYRKFLLGADILLIAYNFDDDSTRYVQFSLANKLPECLVSRRPLLIYGPPQVATVALMQEVLPETVVSSPGSRHVQQQIARLADSEETRHSLAERGYELALSRFRLADQRAALREAIEGACAAPFRAEIRRAARSEGNQIDECALIADLFARTADSRERCMIDVGAHHGSALKPFAERGWSIYAFEPDEENRTVLEERFGSAENVSIDRRAVADQASTAATFYSSEVSTGIRGLRAFHESHFEAASVAVTTLSDVTAAENIQRVDFLKIDVEGYDLAVLKGFPWERLQPLVVICEFEDAKTKPLGHDWQNIADYLIEQGYSVFVSEWYPIVRYGIRHDWRSLREYPCELADPAAWGNLLAFRQPPALNDLARAAAAAVSQPESSSRANQRQRAVRYLQSIVRAILRRIRSRLR